MNQEQNKSNVQIEQQRRKQVF